MADQLNMGGLSLADSQHANTNGISGRSTYIPPHMRGVAQGPPPSMDGAPPSHMNGNLNNSVWSGPARCVIIIFLGLTPAPLGLIKIRQIAMLEMDRGLLPIGPTPQTSPHVPEGMEHQEERRVVGIQAVHLDLTRMLMAPVEVPAPMVGLGLGLPVDLVMANGGMANTSQARPTHVSSVSCSVSLMILQNCKLESISQITMIYQSKPQGTTFPTPFYNSPTRLWTTTYYPT